jgi:hypothetical protein
LNTEPTRSGRRSEGVKYPHINQLIQRRYDAFVNIEAIAEPRSWAERSGSQGS